MANRGEVALRIIGSAHAKGLRTVAVYATDDADSPHVRAADEAHELNKSGVAGYLDIDHLIEVASSTGCTLVHPGYGFLSENADFADACTQAGLVFVGPRSDALRLFGDKIETRRLATHCNVSVLPATDGPVDVEQAREFMRRNGDEPVIVKAAAGGGGRGMRVVTDAADLADAVAGCRSEAERNFGNGAVYVERYVPRSRHVEVQVVGDGGSAPLHLWDRECSIQRRHQKVVEIAPAPDIGDAVRSALCRTALDLACAVRISGLATFEFLLDLDNPGSFYFIEANPRLQVEHGVTEQITGLDLVRLQLDLALGRTLQELNITQATVGGPDGTAIEARVTTVPSRTGDNHITRFDMPTGDGIRVDTHGSVGMAVSEGYDPLLAKIIAHADSYSGAVETLREALDRTDIVGPATDLDLLRWILRTDEVRNASMSTSLVDRHLAALEPVAKRADGEAETLSVVADHGGAVVAVVVQAGEFVGRGSTVAVIESMKMEQEITAPVAGVVHKMNVSVGQTLRPRARIATLIPTAEDTRSEQNDALRKESRQDSTSARTDLEHIEELHRLTLDSSRTEAVERRHATGKRTARENVDDLFVENTFHEYGSLVIPAQRRRRSVDDLRANAPADGVITGFGQVNDAGSGVGVAAAVVAFDWTVMAGTQGLQGHKKVERLFELAGRRTTPVVMFVEGGGGRPGDTDNLAKATGMDLGTFVALGRLNGLVPTVAVVSGRSFAGNAALAGACDVIVATADTSIGMGGPAMIEGGGLGAFQPEDVGPVSVQGPNGVIDVVVADEATAVKVAQRYLGFFSGQRESWSCADQALLRHIVPERRSTVFDIREVIDILADTDSVLELRSEFGPGIVTALARIEGTAVGVVANNGQYLGGAIDRDGADKMARFLQLCDAHGLPVVTLCDTPGFMVGPNAEQTAMVRHVSRLFVTAPNLSVPLCAVVIRKAYGLGGQAMAGGSFRVPDAMLAWPTGDLGAMGPEGAVRLGFKRELDAIDDMAERQAAERRYIAEYEDQGRAHNAASVFEIDDVIDPAQTRSWIAATVREHEAHPPRPGGQRRIDTW